MSPPLPIALDNIGELVFAFICFYITGMKVNTPTLIDASDVKSMGIKLQRLETHQTLFETEGERKAREKQEIIDMVEERKDKEIAEIAERLQKELKEKEEMQKELEKEKEEKERATKEITERFQREIDRLREQLRKMSTSEKSIPSKRPKTQK